MQMTMRRTFMKTVATVGIAAMSLGAASLATAEELDTIREAGVIRIAMSGAYPPFNFVNDQNEVVGFDPAIGTEIARRMGLEVEIVTTAWDGIIAGLLTNRYDAIVGSMSITPERDEVLDFVGPYYTTRRAIFTLPDSGITSVSQLDDVTLGVTLGETHEEWAREQGYNVPHLSRSARTDSRASERPGGRHRERLDRRDPRHGRARHRVCHARDLETDVIGAGIAIREGNPMLAAEMQAALDAMMEDGTYLEIAKEWVGGDIR
jgi:polar amino acid transport system substrate-binding protein